MKFKRILPVYRGQNTYLDQKQQIDLMEIIEDRHGRSSTIIASQLPVSSWYETIGEASIADMILDRLAHTSCRIALEGPSLRKNCKFGRNLSF